MTRIVVVDDDTDVRETTVLLLDVLGHEVKGFGDHQAALEAAKEADVVLQDVHMPGMDLSAQLDRYILLPRRPGVVLFSATVDVRVLSGMPGVRAVLSKPFTADQLEAAVAAALEGS